MLIAYQKVTALFGKLRKRSKAGKVKLGSQKSYSFDYIGLSVTNNNNEIPIESFLNAFYLLTVPIMPFLPPEIIASYQQ